VIFTLTAIGVVGAYSLRSVAGLTASLVLAIFGVSAVLPVLNAFTSELFPTSLRSDAFAWSNNLLGRSVGVLSHIGVGVAAARVGWGPAIAATSVFPLVALGLIWVLLPETVGKELEETSATG
jgi:putative MFS transporter